MLLKGLLPDPPGGEELRQGTVPYPAEPGFLANKGGTAEVLTFVP